MKAARILTLVLFTFFALVASGSTQDPSPREQFQAAVAAYQKSANEETAQKLALLLKKLDPPPAVPEEADFRALKGAAFVKQAGDAAAFAKAASEFQAAIAIAPWVGEYHYNLAICEKSAGRFSAAQGALKLAKVFARDDKERRDCLVLRAELEAAQELEGANKGKAAAKKEAEARGINAIAGDWVFCTSDWKRLTDQPLHIRTELRDKEIVFITVFEVAVDEYKKGDERIEGRCIPAGNKLSGTWNNTAKHPLEAIVSDDQRTIHGRVFNPRTGEKSQEWFLRRR